MAVTPARTTVISAAKVRKYRKLRVRTDGVNLEERASPSYLAGVKERKAFSMEALLAAYRLIELMLFLENLAKSRGPLFDIVYRPGIKEPFLQEKQLGSAFERCIQLKLGKLKSELPDHVFHPALEIFNQYQLQFPYREAIVQPEIKEDPVHYARAVNHTAQLLRNELTGKTYQKQVNAFIQATNRNYGTLMSYIDLLFSKCATLWVIRLDLTYARALDDYDVVKHDRERFLRSLRESSPVGEPFGYAWKLERPTNKSWRHHFLLFFRPQKGQDAVGIAQALGDYWNTSITQKKGAFLNCNALLKGARRRLGTGEISRTRFSPDSPLEQAVWYMTQLDYYIKLRPDRKWKTFFGGNKTTAEKKRATVRRPRKPRQTLASNLSELSLRRAMPRRQEEP